MSATATIAIFSAGLLAGVLLAMGVVLLLRRSGGADSAASSVARLGELQQPLEGVAALRGGLTLAQHHTLHVVVDVEWAGQGGSPYGSSTWPIVSWLGPICHPFLRMVIRILIMY